MRNDGKYLEEALEEELLTLANKRSGFKYRRLPDARAARGLISAQPADFFACAYGHPIYLECKTSKSKTLRLTKFSQHAELLGWTAAGVSGYVLVHFYVPDRLFLVSVMDLDITKPSWVIPEVGGVEVETVKEALMEATGWKY